MSAALGVYRLQQVDSQIDRIQTRQKQIAETLQNDLTLQSASEQLRQNVSSHSEGEQVVKKSEAEVEKQRIKIQQAEASLYGGLVRNPKELQDLQKDIASLKRYLETLEERELEAMLVVESAEKDLRAAEDNFKRVQSSRNEQNHDLIKENESLEKDLERLEHERNAILSDLASQMVATYDQIRKQRRGIAVTTINESACAACGTTLTLSLQQSARSTTQLFTCPTCGRILYA